MKNRLLFILALLCLALCLTGCGSSAKTMKLANVNAAANTFEFVDTSSKQVIAYDRLTLMGKAVIDHACVSALSGGVAFAVEEGQIVRDGNQVTLNGLGTYTTEAELEYECKDGTLNILKMKD